MLARALPLLALAAFALPACGGGEDTSAPTETPAAARGSGGAVNVAMQDIQFAPKEVTVAVGNEVRWTNMDPVVHDAVAKGDYGPKSELFGKGESYSWKATKPGRVEYVCTVHPGMEGTINVVPAGDGGSGP